MYFKLFTHCIFPILLTLASSNLYQNPQSGGNQRQSNVNYLKYSKYTFYYETYQYDINPQNDLDEPSPNTNKSQTINTTPNAQISNESYADSSIATTIAIDNLSIHILKSSEKPYIISITPLSTENETEKDKNEISLTYQDDEAFNSIEIWYTPHRQRRRLRLCTWRHSYRCGWWGWSRCTHHHHHWCAPIAPPRHDPYWNQKWKRVGRFIAWYPSVHWIGWYHYWNCAHHCVYHAGGLASIHSKHENDQVKAACWDVLINPGAKNQRDYSGHWRGHSCYIGITRPFKTWDDRTKVDFKWWYPGEPNNWGHREHCTETYIWHDGRWNDLNCHHKRTCMCQDPRGIVHGKYIGVQMMRPYHWAKVHCNVVYGTEPATIMTDEDNTEAKKLCEKISMKNTAAQCWIGLKNPFEEWEDGTDAEEHYTNWYPGKPWYPKYHQCTEMVTWNPWNGKWNNLHCNYYRYVMCNAQTKLQRMDFYEREEMIDKRMTRHKMRWEKFQEEAKRRKIRKEFFEKMKKQKAEMRKARREQQQKMREYYRQMAFQNAMNNAQSQFGAQQRSYSSGGYGAFGAQSVFNGDTYGKRRRLRSWLVQNSKALERNADMRQKILAKKQKKAEIFRGDKLKMRETDEDAMFYDRVFGLDINIDDELKEAEEDVNPSPMRCIIVRNNGVRPGVYELCINDDKVEVSRYMDKALRFDSDEMPEMPEMEMESDRSESDPAQGMDFKIVDFDEFEGWRYDILLGGDFGGKNESESGKELEIGKIGRTQYLRINEFIYDHEKTHKRQCYDDEDKEYEICLEYESGESVMYLFVREYEAYVRMNEHSGVSFEDDTMWNKVNRIHGIKKEKVEKCVNFFQRKICVIKMLSGSSVHNQNSVYSGVNEYRIIVMKQMKEMDDNPNDEYTQMVRAYHEGNQPYQYSDRYGHEYSDNDFGP